MTQPRLCPICARPLGGDEVARFRPFCSRRCADLDLGRWLKGTYAIPAAELDDEAETEPSAGEREPGTTAETDVPGPARSHRVKH